MDRREMQEEVLMMIEFLKEEDERVREIFLSADETRRFAAEMGEYGVVETISFAQERLSKDREGYKLISAFVSRLANALTEAEQQIAEQKATIRHLQDSLQCYE